MCIAGHCNSVHWAPLDKAEVLSFPLDNNILVWVKPMDYCTNLSQQNVNNIREYPEANYNTFSIQQMRELVGLTSQKSGVYLIHAASEDTMGLMCLDKVELKFKQNKRETYHVNYEYVLGSKDITTRKLASMEGIVVAALGTKIKKTLDPSRCFLIVVSLYGLLKMMDDFISMLVFNIGSNKEKLRAIGYQYFTVDDDESEAGFDDENDLLSMTF